MTGNNNQTPGSPPQYGTPRDVYVQSLDPVTLEALAERFKGTKGWSLGTIRNRCNREDWPTQRIEFWQHVNSEKDRRAAQKISKDWASSLNDLNQRHDKLIEVLIGMHKGLISQYVTTDANGNKTITCRANELARLSQSVVNLIHTQRLLHGYQPRKPDIEMGGVGGDDADPFVDALAISAQFDWGDGDDA